MKPVVVYLTQLTIVLLTLYNLHIYSSRPSLDARLHSCSNSLNLVYPACVAQEEQSDQTSAGDEEEATGMQVRRRHQPGPTAVDRRLHRLQLTRG